MNTSTIHRMYQLWASTGAGSVVRIYRTRFDKTALRQLGSFLVGSLVHHHLRQSRKSFDFLRGHGRLLPGVIREEASRRTLVVQAPVVRFRSSSGVSVFPVRLT